MQTLFGQKIQQTQRFLENGTRIPVTVVAISANTVLSVKTLAKDGYIAMQVGTGSRRKATKSQLGLAQKANLPQASRHIKEVRFFEENPTVPEVGSTLQLTELLQPGDIIDVTGTSKGKGWAGVVKRHHFRGGPRTHGQSDRERAPGSLGQTTTPGRVYKGKRMAGRMGHETVTVQNLFVADIIGTNLYVAGLIPGSVKSFVTITKKGTLAEKRQSKMLRADGYDAQDEVMPVQEAEAETQSAPESDVVTTAEDVKEEHGGQS